MTLSIFRLHFLFFIFIFFISCFISEDTTENLALSLTELFSYMDKFSAELFMLPQRKGKTFLIQLFFTCCSYLS